MRIRIAVIGTDDVDSTDVLDAARQIGSDIAKAGAVLVCGGRHGVMRAACQGAKDNGGLTVGIMPSLDKSEANEFVDIPITTGLGYTRNCVVVGSADVVIAIHGSTGTLSEIAMALNFDRPVVCVTGVGGITDSIKRAFRDNPRIQDIVESDAVNAVKVALSLI